MGQWVWQREQPQCYSASNFDPMDSNDVNGLARRSAPNNTLILYSAASGDVSRLVWKAKQCYTFLQYDAVYALCVIRRVSLTPHNHGISKS